MHGYQANAELVRREIKDWAGISRPQVYYSLEKLANAGMIRSLETDEPASGPERSSFETTARGARRWPMLSNEKIGRHRGIGRPFLTWVALSWQARPGVSETADCAAPGISRKRKSQKRRKCYGRFWRKWDIRIMKRFGW